MSISDLIVVMNKGIVQQIGNPQAVYDNPDSLFVAKFLGTPPINVFEGQIKNQHLYIGEEAVLQLDPLTKEHTPRKVFAAVRPEAFVLKEDGPLSCKLSGVEVMGRDVSVVSTNSASLTPKIRSIISAENKLETANPVIRFALRPKKVFLFDKETEKRIYVNLVSQSEGGMA